MPLTEKLTLSHDTCTPTLLRNNAENGRAENDSGHSLSRNGGVENNDLFWHRSHASL